MKTIKEKAKAYDEAITRARVWKEKSGMPADRQGILDDIFPELKDSEDERIRKELIFYLGDMPEDTELRNGVTNRDVLAWLEKQGEEKSIWHNEDEIPLRGSLILLIMQSGTPIVAKIIEPNHIFNHGERWAYIDDLLEKQDSQNLANSTKTCKDEQKPVLSEDDELSCFESALFTAFSDAWQSYLLGEVNVKQWAKEHSKELLEAAKEELKEHWSEEDSMFIKILRTMIAAYVKDDEERKKLVRWFDIHCNAYPWKPSEEQMEALANIMKYFDRLGAEGETIDNLIRLKEQLKKLKEG